LTGFGCATLPKSQSSKSPLAACSNAVLHALSQYCNAVLARRRIDEGEIREEAGIALIS
jgi:hypothetical protein